MAKKSFIRQVAAAVLGLLGFASCEEVETRMLCMYGQPSADFKAVGTVTDEAGKPVEGIRVAVRQHRHYANTASVIYDQNDTYINDTLFTDAKGSFELVKSEFDAPKDVTIVFEDIDGAENGGEFQKATATPPVVQTKKGDKSWYGGAFQVEANVQLKKK